MKLFIVGLLAAFGASSASAAPCIAVGHTIAAEPAGFVPNAMYFCVDPTKPLTNDKIYIQNNSGKPLKIKYKSVNGADAYTSTIGNGAKSPALSAPGGGAFSAYADETYCTRYYSWGQCRETATRTVDVYSASNAGTLVIGNAPDSY